MQILLSSDPDLPSSDIFDEVSDEISSRKNHECLTSPDVRHQAVSFNLT